MKRVLTAVVLIPLVLLVVFKAPLWLFALVVAGSVVLALHEYLNIAEIAGYKPFHRLTYAVALLLLYFFWNVFGPDGQRANSGLSPSFWWLPFLLFPLIFGMPVIFRSNLRMGLSGAAASAFGVIYVACSLGLLIAFRTDPFQRTLVIFVLFSVWAGDIAAYYIGKNFGKHKLAPVVSPNKSWEGAIASVVASVVVAILVVHFGPQIQNTFGGRAWVRAYWTLPSLPKQPPFLFNSSWIQVVFLGILTNIAAQFGDLFESALKRDAGVKDSGSLLPGHGGILDRIDALLFAIPVVWYYANFTGFLQPKFF